MPYVVCVIICHSATTNTVSEIILFIKHLNIPEKKIKLLSRFSSGCKWYQRNSWSCIGMLWWLYWDSAYSSEEMQRWFLTLPTATFARERYGILLRWDVLSNWSRINKLLLWYVLVSECLFLKRYYYMFCRVCLSEYFRYIISLFKISSDMPCKLSYFKSPKVLVQVKRCHFRQEIILRFNNKVTLFRCLINSYLYSIFTDPPELFGIEGIVLQFKLELIKLLELQILLS